MNVYPCVEGGWKSVGLANVELVVSWTRAARLLMRGVLLDMSNSMHCTPFCFAGNLGSRDKSLGQEISMWVPTIFMLHQPRRLGGVDTFTVPQRGIRKRGSYQHITSSSCLSRLNINKQHISEPSGGDSATLLRRRRRSPWLGVVIACHVMAWGSHSAFAALLLDATADSPRRNLAISGLHTSCLLLILKATIFTQPEGSP